MKKALLLCLLLVTALALPWRSAGQVSRSWRDFYTHASRYGQLGLVRSEADNRLGISTLVPDRTLTVPQIGDRHFVFNHYTANMQAPAVTYVAVLLFLAYPADASVVKPSLVVHRNDGWWRRYCPPSRPSCYAEAGESHQFFDPALAEKARVDHLQDKVEVLDRDLNRKFDGYPIPATEQDSWEQRRFFTRAPKDDPVCSRPGVKCVVEYQLLRFSPTHWASTQAKLDFHANTWSVTAASIYVFSPEEAFDAHYTVEFSRPS